MSMGKRKRDRQPAMWVTTTDLPTAASHPFYRRLNQLLREHGFDDFVEAQCAGFYAATMGRPGLPPGIYFRLLLIGYFEGIDSERGIAWRAADSLALRDFLGLDLHDVPPDHSTISRTRRLIVVETHRAVFTWVAQCLGHAGLIKGKTIGLDATTLEANAALRSIVRRDTGEGYEDFLTRLAKASGIGTPTRADLARLDRKRKKKGSNDEWTHPRDPDAKITKMKDGRTHLAHKAEHAIDLETGAIVGVTVQGADQGDTTTMQQTLPEAAAQLEAVAAVTDDAVKPIEEVVADKGYHSRTTVHDLETLEIRTYISEPDRGPQSWIDQRAERDAVYANRRRIRGARGKRLLRRRGELLERPCAHLYETGGLRRAHVHGHENVLKRLLVHASAFNLDALARRIGQPTAMGRELLRYHHETFEKFWEWSDNIQMLADARRKLTTVFDWALHVASDDFNPRTLRNFPVQAHGAEILRLAACLLTETGITTCALVHDAVLVEAPLDQIDATVAETRELMVEAGRVVLGGFKLRVEAKVVRHPDRFTDEAGAAMWTQVEAILRALADTPRAVEVPSA